jgi:hypothetical protein
MNQPLRWAAAAGLALVAFAAASTAWRFERELTPGLTTTTK